MTDVERQGRHGATSCGQRPYGELSDEKLVAACRAGDARAWEELVQRYQRLIYTVPMRLGLSEDEAGDVFQQTCLRLFERLDTLRDPSRLDAWLVSTSRRLSLDALARCRGNRQASETALLSERVDDAPRPEESLALLEEQQRIRRAVAQLPSRCRALLYHLFYDREEPSYAHIATTLGMPTGSIGPVRARCFAKLKALLGPA
jgi:RNA polymerase sigma factor (sigma-70 family)